MEEHRGIIAEALTVLIGVTGQALQQNAGNGAAVDEIVRKIASARAAQDWMEGGDNADDLAKPD